MMLTHVSLFSGIGGFDLAAEWAGFRTVLMCERDPYCRRVLERHWPHVPIAPDIHTLTGEIVRGHLRFDYRAAALSDADSVRCDVRRPEGQGIHRQESARDEVDTGRFFAFGEEIPISPGVDLFTGVDLLTGGFPCQPFSVAGKQRGAADDRHLWPQMLRVIAEVRPRWVVAENVAGFVRMALDDVLADLEAAGYETGAVVLPACGVGAWHRRERVFIIAADRTESEQQGHPTGVRGEQSGRGAATGREDLRLTYGQAGSEFARSDGEDVPDADRGRCEQCDAGEWGIPEPHALGGRAQSRLGGVALRLPDWVDGYWDAEPAGLPRVAQGVANRVNRLRALGNAVVPQQVYPILAAIAETFGVLPLGA